eukprot:GHUV01040176.1.p2 GENE.GHUV01040176.1~~GHUV01040176.1.p2  ORF type:complete len:164 (+),score=40.85 GHUV01040176.1:416-907(+)
MAWWFQARVYQGQLQSCLQTDVRPQTSAVYMLNTEHWQQKAHRRQAKSRSCWSSTALVAMSLAPSYLLYEIKYGTSDLMTPGYMYMLSWSGPGAIPSKLNPAYLQPDPLNKRCSWYTAQPGDTLAGVWRASGVETLQQLMAANKNAALVDGSKLAGKQVHICK